MVQATQAILDGISRRDERDEMIRRAPLPLVEQRLDVAVPAAEVVIERPLGSVQALAEGVDGEPARALVGEDPEAFLDPVVLGSRLQKKTPA
jgi:hypothetical protein